MHVEHRYKLPRRKSSLDVTYADSRVQVEHVEAENVRAALKLSETVRKQHFVLQR